MISLGRFQLADGSIRVGVDRGQGFRLLPSEVDSLSSILHAPDPVAAISRYETEVLPSAARLLAPVEQQEVWAAGVTYRRSRQARMEESERAASFYDLVYSADRPELFLKATHRRVVGPGEPVRVRADSRWTVPEPELTLVIRPDGQIVGYTIGNDMSARDIEGENPLYLPQAKIYDGSAAIGPVILLASAMPPPEQVTITLEIERAGSIVFQGETDLSAMKRALPELVAWLVRETSFPDGVLLMTGTGIVPPDDFSLEDGDMVSITISPIGTLRNPVTR